MFTFTNLVTASSCHRKFQARSGIASIETRRTSFAHPDD